MSPTSYQTAPPRIKIITQRGEAETNSDHGCWLNLKFSYYRIMVQPSHCTPTHTCEFGGCSGAESESRSPFRSALRCRFLLACTLASVAQLFAFAGIHDLLGIDCFPVNLLLQNLAVFPDQEVDAA